MASPLSMTPNAIKKRARRARRAEARARGSIPHQVLQRGRPRKRDTVCWARELYERGFDDDIIRQALSQYRDIVVNDALAAIKATAERMSIGIFYDKSGFFSRVRKRARGPLPFVVAEAVFAEMSEDAKLITAYEPTLVAFGEIARNLKVLGLEKRMKYAP